jgi:multiple sugar transport system ATP-binding protein
LAPGQREILVGEVPVTVPELREAVDEADIVLGVRPEHVRLDDGSRLRAEVYGAEYLGTTQIVTLRTGHGTVKARLSSSSPVRVGETVGIAFRPEKLSLFEVVRGRAVRTALHDAAALTGGRRHG